MNGDVRSLEEVIAAAHWAWSSQPGPNRTALEIAAAVREWCRAPEQIEAAARGMWANDRTWETVDRTNRAINVSLAAAALQAVMGDTP